MKTYTKIKSFISRVRNFFPQALPVGVTEFQAWSDSLIRDYGFPDNDSVRFSVAVMILHLDAKVAYKRKWYFAKCLHKAMSNQIVSQVINDLKAKQQAELAAAKSAEVTAAAPVQAVTYNGPQK